MKEMTSKLIRLIIGLFLYAVGVVLTINGNLGLAPWDIFHQGLSLHLNMTMGQANICVSIIIVIIDFAFKEKIGIGTLCNMILIGIFIDFLMLNHLIPIYDQVFLQMAMMVLGMFTIGFATFVYIGPELGAGPRDGLMIALCKKTGKSVRVVRMSIEVTVAVVGFLLGGKAGLGTVVMALGLGPVTQFVFRLCKFDVKKLQHHYIDEDIRKLLQKALKK